MIINLLEVFVVLSLIAAFGSIGVASIVASRRSVPGSGYLAATFLGCAVWCGAYAAELMSASLDAKVFWAKVAYVGIVIAPPSWLLFAAAHVGLLPSRRITPFLYVIPAATLVFVVLATDVGLVWSQTYIASSGALDMLVVDHGSWFWLHTVYSYACMAAGSTLLILGVVRQVRALTLQAVVMVLAALLPWVTNVLTIFQIVPVYHLDLTPPAFALSILLMLMALWRLEAFEIFPAMVTIAHHTVLREMQDGVVVTDLRGRILSVNEAAQQLLTAKRNVAGELLEDVLTMTDGDGNTRTLEAAAQERDGLHVLIEGHSAAMIEGVVTRLGRVGSWRGYVLVLRDVTEREATTRALRSSEERLRVLFDKSPVAVFVYDADLRVTECNDLLAKLLGISREAFVGSKLTVANASSLLSYCETALRGETSTFDGPFRIEGGEELWLQCRVSPLFSDDGPTGGMCVAWDLTSAKRAEALIERLAFHDTLTGLPNRSLLRDRLRQAIDEAEQGGTSVALGLLDIDRFKTLNEAIGHGTADELLHRLARRFEAVVRRGDTVARVAGDEFAFVLPSMADTAAALRMGEQILGALRETWELGGHTFTVTGSLGLALYPYDGEDAFELLENAERALRRARDAGGDRQQFYDLSMNLEAAERLEIEQGLRTAIAEGQLDVHYEPQISLEDGSVRGVEALVRWHHPERGLLMPASFIAIAEDSGQIGRIGEWVLRQACTQVANCNAKGGSELRVAVNLSPRDLLSGTLPATIADVLAATGLAPHLLEIELTETAVITELEASCRALEHVRDLGVSVVLDDFGTGYASLSHLHGLPIDKVKIDRSFVARCEEDEGAASIVAALVSLAHSLHLRVVAEGIETPGQAKFPRSLGCDEAQGYLISHPAPADSCPAFTCWQRSTVAIGASSWLSSLDV